MKANILATSALFALLALYSSCDSENNAINNGKLPCDPNKWVCQDSLTPPTQQEIDEWCLENINNSCDLKATLLQTHW